MQKTTTLFILILLIFTVAQENLKKRGPFEIGFETAFRTESYSWVIEPMAGAYFRYYTNPIRKNRILLTLGTNIQTTADKIILPYYEVGVSFKTERERWEPLAIFRNSFGVWTTNIGDDVKRYGLPFEARLEAVEYSILLEIFHYKTHRGNVISYCNPRFNLVVPTERKYHIQPSFEMTIVKYGVRF